MFMLSVMLSKLNVLSHLTILIIKPFENEIDENIRKIGPSHWMIDQLDKMDYQMVFKV